MMTESKYIKYKHKYLKLKKQYGGQNFSNNGTQFKFDVNDNVEFKIPKGFEVTKCEYTYSDEYIVGSIKGFFISDSNERNYIVEFHDNCRINMLESALIKTDKPVSSYQKKLYIGDYVITVGLSKSTVPSLVPTGKKGIIIDEINNKYVVQFDIYPNHIYTENQLRHADVINKLKPGEQVKIIEEENKIGTVIKYDNALNMYSVMYTDMINDERVENFTLNKLIRQKEEIINSFNKFKIGDKVRRKDNIYNEYNINNIDKYDIGTIKYITPVLENKFSEQSFISPKLYIVEFKDKYIDAKYMLGLNENNLEYVS